MWVCVFVKSLSFNSGVCVVVQISEASGEEQRQILAMPPDHSWTLSLPTAQYFFWPDSPLFEGGTHHLLRTKKKCSGIGDGRRLENC